MDLFKVIKRFLFLFSHILFFSGCIYTDSDEKSKKYIEELFNPPVLPASTLDNPYRAETNTFRIKNSNYNYITFTTTKDAIMRMSITCFCYRIDTPFTIIDTKTNYIIPFKSGEVLPAGDYKMSISTDITTKYGLFFTFWSSALKDIHINEFPSKNIIEGIIEPNFRTIWKLNLNKSKCITVSGGAGLIVYDKEMNYTHITIKNNTKCIEPGTYYTLLFSRNIKYSKKFKLEISNHK